jgi:hypothetical protein
MRGRRLTLVAALLALALGPPAALADSPQPGPLDLSGDIAGAPFRIIVPANWNGKLIVHAHGYVDEADHPGEVDEQFTFPAPGPITAATLLGQGWALAGTAYKDNGWAVQEALDDLVALTGYFKDNVGNPTRTLLVGGSMGSVPTLELAERNGGAFDGYIAYCSIGAGTSRSADGLATLRLAYDIAFGLPASWGTVGDGRDDIDFESEVVPHLFSQIVNPLNFGKFEFIRLVAGVPGSGIALPPSLNSGWLFSDMFFATEAAGELERRAGGPISQNLTHLYRLSDGEKAYLAVLGVDADALLAGMNARRNISAPAASRNYVEHYSDFTGKIKKPVLALHTVVDELVPVAHEAAYAESVEAAGRSELLAQAYTSGPGSGHCAFNAAQHVAAVNALDTWIATGSPPTDAALPPALGFVPGYDPPHWPP